MPTKMNKTLQTPLLAVLAVAAVVAAAMHPAHAAPRPQDAATNNIVAERAAMSEEDGESLIAGLILAVARDWDRGHQPNTEFLGVVPAVSVNGTTFGPTSHPINESGPISFTAPMPSAGSR